MTKRFKATNAVTAAQWRAAQATRDATPRPNIDASRAAIREAYVMLAATPAPSRKRREKGA
jgi:hypothetical protein